MFVCKRVCLCVCMCVRMCVRACMFVRVRGFLARECVTVRACMRICVCVCACVCVFVCVYVYVRVCTFRWRERKNTSWKTRQVFVTAGYARNVFHVSIMTIN